MAQDLLSPNRDDAPDSDEKACLKRQSEKFFGDLQEESEEDWDEDEDDWDEDEDEDGEWGEDEGVDEDWEKEDEAGIDAVLRNPQAFWRTPIRCLC